MAKEKKTSEEKKSDISLEEKKVGSEDALLLAIAEISKKHGEEAISRGKDRSHIKVKSIPTSLPSLDAIIGCGGIPRGRIIEIYGSESSGKTTLSLQLIAACQQQGGRAAFIDAEHALDPDWATKIGVNMDELLISQPTSGGEEALYIVECMVRHKACDLIVIDSVAALTPKSELEGELSDADRIGAQARMLSKGLRRLIGCCSKSETVVVFINQLREKIGGFSPFGPAEGTPGGRALKHYASIRLEVKRSVSIKKGDTTIGSVVKIKAAKNKVAPPFRSIELQIYFGMSAMVGYESIIEPIYGFDRTQSLFDGAKALGVLTAKGSNYYLGESKLENGEKKVVEKMRRNKELAKSISDACSNAFTNTVVIPAEVEDEEEIDLSTLEGVE